MAGPGNLEEYLLLPFEQDLAVVHSPRGIHVAIGFDQLIAGETFVGLTGFPDIALGYRSALGSVFVVAIRFPLDASVQDLEAL